MPIDVKELVNAIQAQVSELRQGRQLAVKIQICQATYEQIMRHYGSDPEKRRLTKLFGIPIEIKNSMNEQWVSILAHPRVPP